MLSIFHHAVKKIRKAYSFFQALSLDVCLASFAMASLFTYQLESGTSNWTYLILMGTVWLIYTFNHLYDALTIPHAPSLTRHDFHQKYFIQIFFVWFLVLLSTIYFVLAYLDSETKLIGILLSTFVCFHFILNIGKLNKPFTLFKKEIRTALFFTLGISLPILKPLSHTLNKQNFYLMSEVFLLVLTNLLILSLFEHKNDRQDLKEQTYQSFSKNTLKKILPLLFLTLYATTFYGAFFCKVTRTTVQGILILTTLSLNAILLRPRFFKRKERYRLLADAAFLYPLFLIFI